MAGAAGRRMPRDVRACSSDHTSDHAFSIEVHWKNILGETGKSVNWICRSHICQRLLCVFLLLLFFCLVFFWGGLFFCFLLLFFFGGLGTGDLGIRVASLPVLDFYRPAYS